MGGAKLSPMRRLPFAAARAAALAAWALVFAALVPAALGLSLQTDAEALCALLSGARPTARAALSSWDCSNSSSTAVCRARRRHSWLGFAGAGLWAGRAAAGRQPPLERDGGATSTRSKTRRSRRRRVGQATQAQLCANHVQPNGRSVVLGPRDELVWYQFFIHLCGRDDSNA